MSTMSTLSAHFGPAPAELASGATSPSKGLWQRFLEARERWAMHRVEGMLGRMSDNQLADIGLNHEQIRHVRVQGTIPADYWR